MIIKYLKTNHIENPVGYLMDSLSLSWIVTEAKGDYVTKVRVKISMDEAMTEIIHDSGERDDIDSVDYSPEIMLKEGERYYWQVQVWDDAGDYGKSQVAYFETAKELKKATWIAAPFEKNVQPLFRKTIKVDQDIVKARLYICGLGVYEAYINGNRIGNEFLTPYCNDYTAWMQYQTYDITEWPNI